MSEEEFWNLTPIEYARMIEQWKEKTNRSQLTTAGLLASVYNIFKRSSAESKSPEDFLPFTPPPRYLSEEDSMAALDAFFTGVIKKNQAEAARS